jgi:hypothetical protein
VSHNIEEMAMAQINVIYVVHTTRNVGNAQTAADFELIVTRPGGDLRRPFPELRHNERERGLTDSYQIEERESTTTRVEPGDDGCPDAYDEYE